MTKSSLMSVDLDQIVDQYHAPFETYQVLNEDGKVVDEAALAEVDDETLVNLMREMVWLQAFDTRMIQFNRQGTLGNYAPAGGQEASQMAPLMACTREDFLVPTYRDVVLTIKHGLPMHQAFLWWRGHIAANQLPDDYHGHIPQVIVGAGIPHAAGVAMGKKLRGDNHVALVYCGDGATSQGDFYEGLNFAGVYKAPLITIVQNNLYAISVPLAQQTAAATIAQKAVSVGIAALRVDGMDPVAMYLATARARQWAVEGNGPVLIEALTYRTGPHTMSDDPKRYRSGEEVAQWEAKSPLVRLRKYLVEKGLWEESQEAEIVEGVHAEMKEALKQMGRIEPQKVTDFLRATFEVPPPNIKEQIEIYQAKEAN